MVMAGVNRSVVKNQPWLNVAFWFWTQYDLFVSVFVKIYVYESGVATRSSFIRLRGYDGMGLVKHHDPIMLSMLSITNFRVMPIRKILVFSDFIKRMTFDSW